ncbi:MAG: AMMECR1 domain-containing protein [Desulfuromonas sp.]|nr:MAG: AMMECR1 domain-containing protein [Desulfuromonas sp.]
MISDHDAGILIDLARETIQKRVRNEDCSPPPRQEPALNVQAGCFVTIKRNGRLRGCIGNFVSSQPLYQTVVDMAIAAATEDPRFAPMSEVELADFEIEITVLSPLEKISDINLIEVGRHGIYIVKGYQRGVLLPQVATEYGWDRETFLQQTCVKAGLPTDAWQTPGIDIYRFSGQIIEE